MKSLDLKKELFLHITLRAVHHMSYGSCCFYCRDFDSLTKENVYGNNHLVSAQSFIFNTSNDEIYM